MEFFEYHSFRYKRNENVAEAIENHEYATDLLNNPEVSYQGGTSSHTVARGILEEANQVLKDNRHE